jgi:hypothetical protein
MQYRLTWLAVILTFVFLIPGEVVGHILAYLYRLLVSGWVFGGDTVFDLFTHGWFSRVGLEGVSGGMQGLAAGLLAALLCDKITKFADFRMVAYCNTALVGTFTVIGLLTSYAQTGLGTNNLVIVANTIGLVGGLFVAAEHIREKQNERWRVLEHLARVERAVKS